MVFHFSTLSSLLIGLHSSASGVSWDFEFSIGPTKKPPLLFRCPAAVSIQKDQSEVFHTDNQPCLIGHSESNSLNFHGQASKALRICSLFVLKYP